MSAPSVSSTPTDSLPVLEQGGSPGGKIGAGVPIWRSAVILGLTLLIALAYIFNPPLEVEPQAGVVMQLPVYVGNFFGEKGSITQVEYDLLPKDTEFARRTYDDGKGHQILCTIVLSGAEQRSIHRPEGCLTGQGWTIVGQDTIPMPLASGRTLMARRLSLERRVVGTNNVPFTLRAFYIYWFVGEKVTTSSEFYRVLLSNWDRVVYNRAHRWAYVSFFAHITDNLEQNGLDPTATEGMLKDFAKKIVPTFQISEMADQARE